MNRLRRFRGLLYVLIAVCATGLVTLNSCSQAPTDVNSSPIPSSAISSPAASSTSVNITHPYSQSTPININDAILSELDKLEAKLGVPGLSNQIQASRPYGSVEELVAKKVITQTQFEQIKDLVTIADVTLTGVAKDIDYMTKLGLMKGHLIVAGELMALQKPKQAEPHIGHPVEEIYVDVEDQLQERGVKEFKSTLINLQDLVKSTPKSDRVQPSFQAATQAVDGAIAALPLAQRQSGTFLLQVINGLLDTAGTEYVASIADGKIAQIIEYQDSRGFVLYADELYKGIENQMKQGKPEAHQTIASSMTKLRQAWPAPTAPAVPAISVKEVVTLIKSIEKSAQSVTVPS